MTTQNKRSFPAETKPTQPLRLAPRQAKNGQAGTDGSRGSDPWTSPISDPNGQPLSRELILRLIEWLEQA
ncbi:MAG TPA: hypothetical protein VF498_10455 [Anaerolineales bacterium]